VVAIALITCTTCVRWKRGPVAVIAYIPDYHNLRANAPIA
jgi:hypothetical protein